MKTRLVLILFLTGVALGEKRFDRQIVSLTTPKAYQHFKQDDNTFPYLTRNGISVSCMTYRGTQFYYVEVGVSNSSPNSIKINPSEFVRFEKPGYTVMLVNTLETAERVVASSSGTFVRTPPPPPASSTTTTTATANTFGNNTQINARSTTTVDNSAANWFLLGQAIAESNFYKQQNVDSRLASYLQRFAHEKQDGLIEPGNAKVFTFTFQPLVQKKAKFNIYVQVADEQFIFSYKE